MKTHAWFVALLSGALMLLAGCVDFDAGEKTWCQRHPEVCTPSFEQVPPSVLYVEKKGVLRLQAGAKDPAGEPLRFTWSSNVGSLGQARDTATTTEVEWTAPECIPPPAATFTLTASSKLGASTQVTFSAIGIPECPTMSGTGRLTVARSGHTATLLYTGVVLVTGGESSGGPLDVAEGYSARAQTWAAAGRMSTPRVDHVAVRLVTGTVLVTGGRNASGVLKSAELVSEDFTWTAAASPSTARHGHAAALLESGKVLVTGGFDGNSVVTTSELYFPGHEGDPVPKWSTTASAPVARNHPVATVVDAGKKVLVTGGTTEGGGYPTSADVYDSATETWTQVDAVGEGRIDHTATSLSPGRVLVTGGRHAGGALGSTVLVDVAQRAATPGPALSTPRYGHTATLLRSGQVLVAGGLGARGEALASTELFDPETGTWSQTVPLAAARHGHEAILLDAGKVLLVGGQGAGGELASAEVYDPGTKTWTNADRLLVQRGNHTATLLPSGQVLVVGGSNRLVSSGAYLSAVERYDSVAGTWRALAPLRVARDGHTATLLASGGVLVVGGYNGGEHVAEVERFDPVREEWLTGGRLEKGRDLHSATRLASGKVLVAGGHDDHGTLATAELYDPVLGTWSRTGPMATARAAHTATLLPSGKVLVAGGFAHASGISAPLQSAELYDPATEQWTSAGALVSGRGAHTATLLQNGDVLVAGGYAEQMGKGSLATAERYDPAKGTWTQTPPFAEKRGAHTATLLPSGKVLIAGGYGGYQDLYFLSPCELYDPATGQWSSTSGVLTPRSNATATLLPLGKVLVVGGYGYNDEVHGEAELFMP
ncbi:kelch-like protein [Myxococcus sp. MISCRS1]|uniref:kelch repeat-containing protein n=1 Tax=Myxococcus sp. MISCRS1 TaxID=2996786 RepID=UPI002271B4CD|nr:kelch repeat-containing protein [Myxococcus sp. MISCRS1]MCY1002889.1 kelch-like protein [Myxococcus sp. MISCRS1]